MIYGVHVHKVHVEEKIKLFWMHNNSNIRGIAEKSEGDHDGVSWLKDNIYLLILFVLILLLILAIVAIIIICKKKWKCVPSGARSTGSRQTAQYVNESFDTKSCMFPMSRLEPGAYSFHNGSCQQCLQCHYADHLMSCHRNTCRHPYSKHSKNDEVHVVQEQSRFLSTFGGLQSLQGACRGPSELEADYSDDGNQSEGNIANILTVPNQELFSNIPKELLDTLPRSTTITVQNKEVVFISRRVTEKGDNLVLDKMGISLFVPPGAVVTGEVKTVVLVLNWDLGDNPNMTEKQALVAPVVYVGPHNLKLNKPCILSFKHCSFDTRHISVMKSETELVEKKDWLEHCSNGEESGDIVLTPDECQLKISSFTLYTCLQSPNGPEESKKWLQVAAFSSPLQSSINHQEVRLYFLNKTPCALQWAIQNEAKFGGQMMGPEKVYLFHGNAQDMFVCLRYLSEGWDNVDKEVEERIPYINIWHGKCPHVSMCFKKKSIPRELTFKLFLYQYLLENDGGNFIAHVTEETKHGLLSENGNAKSKQEIVVTLPSKRNNFNNNEDTCTCNNDFSSGLEHQVHFHFKSSSSDVKLDKVESASSHFYPHDMKTNLKVLLDPPSPFDRDWKALAMALGREKCIRFISQVDSPTECLLCDAETRMISLETLKDVFLTIQRRDAAEVVQGFIPHRNEEECNSDTDRRSRPSPSENTFNFNVVDQ